MDLESQDYDSVGLYSASGWLHANILTKCSNSWCSLHLRTFSHPLIKGTQFKIIYVFGYVLIANGSLPNIGYHFYSWHKWTLQKKCLWIWLTSIFDGFGDRWVGDVKSHHKFIRFHRVIELLNPSSLDLIILWHLGYYVKTLKLVLISSCLSLSILEVSTWLESLVVPFLHLSHALPYHDISRALIISFGWSQNSINLLNIIWRVNWST